MFLGWFYLFEPTKDNMIMGLDDTIIAILKRIFRIDNIYLNWSLQLQCGTE